MRNPGVLSADENGLLPLLTLLGLGPLFLFPRPQWVWVLAVIPLLWAWHWLRTRHFVPRTPLDWPIALMLIMVLVSLWATPDLAFSLPKVSGVLWGIGLYYALVEATPTGRRLGWGAAGLLTVGVGLAAVGLLGTRWATKVPALNQLTSHLPLLVRLPGSEEGFSPNQLGGALVWLIPLALSLVVWSLGAEGSSIKRRRWLVGSALAGAFMLGTLLLTQSRGSWLGLSVGVLLLMWAAGLWGRVVAVVGLGLGVAGLTWIGPQRLGEMLFGSGATATRFVAGGLSLQGRVEIWSRALYGIQDFPFTGMGMNMFRRVVHILYPLFLVSPDKDIAHAHNEFLQAALDLGIPGLVAFIALYLLAFWVLFQVGRRAPDPFHRALALGLAGGLLAHMVYGMTDAVALGAKPGFVWWVLLALSAALYRLQPESGR